MFRFFKYIILFILGYKVLKSIFAEQPPQQQRNPQPVPPRDDYQRFTADESTTDNTKYNNAELIDYEEVK